MCPLHLHRGMTTRKLAWGLLGASLLAAFGCSVTKEEDRSEPASKDSITAGGTSADVVLKSTLFLDAGCVATKVGPRHLLVAARCVVGKPAFAANKKLSFVAAATGDNKMLAAADAGDAGDAGKPEDARELVVASVEVHASFAAKCKEDLCDFEMLDASDAPDIAVVVAKADIAAVPSLPIDLDTVSPGDPLLVVGTGCERFDERGTTRADVTRSLATPASVVNHVGSAYKTSPQLVTRLGGSYVVSPGVGWKTDAPRVCASDVGAPIVRGNVAAVAGITSNFTTFQRTRRVPVTLHHTRVDAASRFKIGDWLKNLGVETVRSCSEAAGGCKTRSYDGGAPAPATGEGETDSDAGPKVETPPDAGEADAATPPSGDPGSHDVPVLGDEEESAGEGAGESSDYDASVPNKKKKKAEESGGCSTSSRGSSHGSPTALLGVALGLALVLRRRK